MMIRGSPWAAFSILITIAIVSCNDESPAPTPPKPSPLQADTKVHLIVEVGQVPEIALSSQENKLFTQIVSREPELLRLERGGMHGAPYAMFRAGKQDYMWFGDYIGVEKRTRDQTVRLVWREPAFIEMHRVFKEHGYQASEEAYRLCLRELERARQQE